MSRVAPLKSNSQFHAWNNKQVSRENNSEKVYDSICRFQILYGSSITWIQSPFRSFKPFVSARVGEIQNNSNPSQWNHIPGEENVADYYGSEFLKLPEEQWPLQTATPHREEHMERRQVDAVSSVSYADVGKVVNVKNFSS